MRSIDILLAFPGILLAIVIPTLLWADLTNIYVWVVLLVTVGFGAVGFVDDYRKVTKRNTDGLSPRQKMFWMVLVALAAGLILYAYPPFQTTLAFPFFKDLRPELGIFYIPFALLVIVGTSHAVNLTDGLDGLAIGPVIMAGGAFGLIAYLTGNFVAADYLKILNVRGAGELAVFSAALIGAAIGFLWFNCHPAEVFMGDAGSLALGGAIGMLAVLTKAELLLPLIGGLYVVEAVSVIVQVASFKLTGQRVFKMAPIHHHFELIGWSEPKVITRFLILAVIFALFSLTTLKLR